MPKQLMNEAERFLLEHWAEARLLEEAMAGVRTKYQGVFQRIIEAVTEAHSELDANSVCLTQSWSDGIIGFGRKSWPNKEGRFPAGLWVWTVRLERLTAEDSEPPSASIWVPNKSKLDFDAARVAVSAVAKELFTPEELKATVREGSGEHLIWLPAPSKHQLLAALSDGDGHGFVKLFVLQFDMMARFVPVLEKVFRECLSKE